MRSPGNRCRLQLRRARSSSDKDRRKQRGVRGSRHPWTQHHPRGTEAVVVAARRRTLWLTGLHSTREHQRQPRDVARRRQKRNPRSSGSKSASRPRARTSPQTRFMNGPGGRGANFEVSHESMWAIRTQASVTSSSAATSPTQPPSEVTGV